MEQRNERQVRYPSGKVRNQVAVDISFLKYQCECPCFFGGKETLQGVLYVSFSSFFFLRGIKSLTPKYTVHSTYNICIFRELQYIEEICKINKILILFISNELFSFFAIFFKA